VCWSLYVSSFNASSSHHPRWIIHTLRLWPSNGSEPVMRVKRITPRLHESTSGPVYFFPANETQHWLYNECNSFHWRTSTTHREIIVWPPGVLVVALATNSHGSLWKSDWTFNLSPPQHHNRFTALFPWLPRWASARKKLLDFMVQGEISEADTPTIRQAPLHPN